MNEALGGRGEEGVVSQNKMCHVFCINESEIRRNPLEEIGFAEFRLQGPNFSFIT